MGLLLFIFAISIICMIQSKCKQVKEYKASCADREAEIDTTDRQNKINRISKQITELQSIKDSTIALIDDQIKSGRKRRDLIPLYKSITIIPIRIKELNAEMRNL